MVLSCSSTGSEGMKKIVGYLKAYFSKVDKWVLLLSAFFAAIGIYCNYHFGLDRNLRQQPTPIKLISWYFIFLTAFAIPYLLTALFQKSNFFRIAPFRALLFIAPAIFAIKMAVPMQVSLNADAVSNAYWSAVIYFPLKLAVMATCLWLLWKIFDSDQPFYGFGRQHFTPQPYLIMLSIMVPLIAAASTQPDFLRMYPKMNHIVFLQGPNRSIYKWLYELSYGTDFISIELFFRGFLVLAFAKWAGKDAILPMALFYCTIHFGKPLGECISSFFGGIILGVVTFHTRTILGGLMIHLGIAWLMELGGYIGNSLQ